MLRPLIKIDEDKCDGCGQCVLDCAEGALAIIDGKARLISEVYCDGLGACLNCPKGALSLETVEAPAFDEEAALKAKAEREGSAAPCATGENAKKFVPLAPLAQANKNNTDLDSSLKTWPVQLELVNPASSWLKHGKLLLSAHCAGFALSDIQAKFKDKVLMIACPKLENREKLIKKLADIFTMAEPASIHILRMSVPCCGGLEMIVNEAKKITGRDIPVKTRIVNL